MADAGEPTDWRSLDELAALVGTYVWVEERIFAITGAWATAPEGVEHDVRRDEARVWCAAVSRRHGELAVRWAARLPVRAGVDAGALVTAPAGPLEGALDALGSLGDAVAGLSVLVEVLLPRLDAVYETHQRSASPVSEAPVLEVLMGARREAAAEIRGGRTLIESVPEGPSRGADLGEKLKRALVETDVFPAVRAS